jgi:hypothetical protein
MRGRKAVEVVLTEIVGQLKAVDVKVDTQGRHTEQMAGTLTDLLGRVEERVSRLEEQKPLAEHAASKNPHPNQEEWLGARFAKQGGEIDGIKDEVAKVREELATFRTQWKVWGIVATALLGVGSPLLVHYLGG